MFKYFIRKFNSKKYSKKVKNILYFAISLVIAFCIMLVSLTFRYIGLEFKGDNFTTYYFYYLFLFTFIFFVGLKKTEKRIISKN